MTHLATNRLIAASAALKPADRALLSLLVNHGLDDETLGRMMHATPPVIAERRQQLMQRLGAELSLPPESVVAALEELAAARERARTDEHSSSEGSSVSEPAPKNGGPPVPDGGAAATPEATTSLSPAVRRQATARMVLLALAILLVVVIVLVVVLDSGNTKRAPTPSAKIQRTATAPTTTPTTTTTPPTTRAPIPAARRATLAPLPGGPAGVSGSASILGSVGRRKLALSVSGLPASRRGHYELWLYNSIIDAFPLGRLRAPSDSVTVALPPRYRHYRWLDVSRQPPGSVNHSGVSILRAPLP